MRPKPGQRGFGVIAAIMILVVLAGLAAFMANFSASQHAGSALDVQGARTFLAARAGLEWGLCRLRLNSCSPAAIPCAAAPGTTTDIGLVDGVAVTVNCITGNSGAAVEPGLGTLYTITSTACNQPLGTTCPGDSANPNYVERRLTILVEAP